MAAATDERLIYEILSAVGEIPEGNVATYGQIARLIGRPKNARLVGRVLSQAERYGDYPCHRVVDHSGRLVPGWDAQAALLANDELNSNLHIALVCRGDEEQAETLLAQQAATLAVPEAPADEGATPNE